jgi:hypothetical protein
VRAMSGMGVGGAAEESRENGEKAGCFHGILMGRETC